MSDEHKDDIKEEEDKKEIQKVTVNSEQLKKEKRKILSQVLWLLLLINFFVGVIAFAIVYQLYIPTMRDSIMFSLSVIMGILVIEGPILIFLSFVTKNRDYSDILFRTSGRRAMMMSQDAREREIEIFNQLVLYTKKLFLVIGLIFTVLGALYFIIHPF